MGDLRAQIEVDRLRLRRLLDVHSILLAKCIASPPNADELAALGAILHAFYNGVENILKRVAVALDGGAPSGETWHADLIESMCEATPRRPGFLSPSLSETLQEYMDFRHVFRHGYSFELRWEKMKGLVLGLDDALGRLEKETEDFFGRLGSA